MAHQVQGRVEGYIILINMYEIFQQRVCMSSLRYSRPNDSIKYNNFKAFKGSFCSVSYLCVSLIGVGVSPYRLEVFVCVGLCEKMTAIA